jgi:hypothetical protein
VADILHALKVSGSADQIREALRSREALQAWHGCEVTGGDGEWRFAFEDGPTFRWQVVDRPGGDVVAWRCLEGPGDSVGTEAKFALSPSEKGRTLVELSHEGWPHRGGKYRECNTRWAVLLHQLRQHVEQGDGAAVR